MPIASRLLLSLGILSALISVSNASAEIFRVCANRSTGDLAIRVRCLSGERQVTNINDLRGPQGEAGPAGQDGQPGAPGPRGPQGEPGRTLSLYDSTNLLVGQVADVGCSGLNLSGRTTLFDATTVILEEQGQRYALCFSSAGIVTSSEIFFESEDCSGQAYLDGALLPLTNSPLYAPSPVGMQNGVPVLYTYDVSLPPQTRFVRAYRQTEIGDCRSVGGGYNIQARPAIEIFVSHERFTAPFAVR
jgi:hypothetical protein